MTNFTRPALVLLALGFWGVVSPCLAQVPGSARVLSIQPTTGVIRVAANLNRVGGVHYTKFLEDGVEVPSAILAVAWSQMPGLAPSDMELRLEYRMDDQPDIRTMRRALPREERGPVTTRLEIPLSPSSGGGHRVTSWRLQLRTPDRVLEEYRSATWR